MSGNPSNRINFTANCIFKVFVLLSIVWIFLPCRGYSAINVDGKMDEPEWANAEKFTEFVVTDPLTLEKPVYSTEALVLSTSEGLIVGFICEQPNNENRTRTITERDARSFNADSVSVMIDFNGDGQRAYEFSVSISDSYRDGEISQENQFTYVWDGVWEHKVNEEEDKWAVEILLPWSIVSMRESKGEKRRLGISFQRQLQSTNQTFAFPAVSSARPHFVSEFAKVEVATYSSKELEIKPYGMALRDNLDGSTTGKMGLDILWKPSQKIHLLATVNPEFGYVESDDLVIDFSAYEVRYTEKRPFFTEDQSLFSDKMSMEDIFYTRRVGSASDKDGKPSDIEAAVKVVGSTASVNYGFFAAQEADDAGRSFYAGRILFPSDNISLGLLSTYIERPFRERNALVNCIDYDFSLGSPIRFTGHIMGSRIDATTGKTSGYGIYNNIRYSPNDRYFFYLSLKHLDDTLDINDMGYANRNNIQRGHLTATYNQTNFSEDSRSALVAWSFDTVYDRTTDGIRLPATISFSRNEKMQSGSSLNARLSYEVEGYDDRISRDHGLVLLKGGWGSSLSYNSQRRGMWGKSISLRLSQEGYDGWSVGIGGNISWYPNEKLNITFSLNPQRSSDWFRWMEGKQIGGFSNTQISSTIGANWFPAERHEVRLRTQWNTVNAKAEQSYNIGDDARLVKDNTPLDDFASTSFALQLRYHYEIAPMSDLYVCYSRGGREDIKNPEDDTLTLLGDSTKLRQSDQIMIKLSYRFKLI